MILESWAYDISRNPYASFGNRAYAECRNPDRQCSCEGHVHSCVLNRLLTYTFPGHIMARGKKAAQNKFGNMEFIRFELTAEDRKNLIVWAKKEHANFDDLLHTIMQQNHKVSFSFNSQNDSYICSVTGKPEDCDNAERCFTSHAKSYSQAAWVALYKYHVVWKAGVWESVDPDEDFG